MIPEAGITGDRGQALPEGDVHIWETQLAPVPGDLWQQMLSRDELQRLNQLRTESGRERFIGRRIFRRVVLAYYTGLPPHKLVFEANSWGKPVLAAQAAGGRLEFSAASSRHVALLAVARNMPIGADLEYIDAGFDFLSVLKNLCCDDDLQQFSRLPATVQGAAFFHRWTELESYGKAAGQGLSAPSPEKFPEWRWPGSLPAMARKIHAPDGTDWWLHSLNLHSRKYCAALCCRGQAGRLKYFRLTAAADSANAMIADECLLLSTPYLQFRVSPGTPGS
jgi:4'-phosphopantetheinyl transferase